MSDTDNTGTGSSTDPKGGQNQGQTPPPANTDPADTKLEDLPESWQKEIKNLRKENGNYRNRANDFESKFNDAQTKLTNQQAEFDGKLADGSLALARFRAAALSGVPADKIEDFASRLRGTTADELAADAANLAEYFGAGNNQGNGGRGIDPSQGRGNNTPTTPAAAFAQQVREAMGRE